jgi:hypothetical protein
MLDHPRYSDVPKAISILGCVRRYAKLPKGAQALLYHMSKNLVCVASDVFVVRKGVSTRGANGAVVC